MVGSRLRCDLGSRSKDCEKNKENLPTEKNGGVSDTTSPSRTPTISGAGKIKETKLPTELISGIGLMCKAEKKEQFLIFTKNKESVGFPIFERDAVYYRRYKVTIWPEWLTWFGDKDLVTKTGIRNYRLNRKTLTLYDHTDDIIFKCSLIAPTELHGIVTEMIENKLKGNKL